MSSTENDPSTIELQWGEAEALFRAIVEDGDVEFTQHAQQELKNDNLHTTDCLNILRGGRVVATQLRYGKIRYRVSTGTMTTVVTLTSETELCVVTAWRHENE